MSNTQRVLVAGATCYLGMFLVKDLKDRDYWVRALSRSSEKIEPVIGYVDEVFIGEDTIPGTITSLCKDVDVVISSLGITQQKDGLTYMDVDYQANSNILDNALSHNISTFMYVSILNSEKLNHLTIVKAKGKFSQELKTTGINYIIIIRPNGFFSDMTDYEQWKQTSEITDFPTSRCLGIETILLIHSIRLYDYTWI